MKLSQCGLIKGALMAAVMAGSMAVMVVPASADIVCNRWHECWRTNTHYNYPIGLGIVIRDEAWARHHHRGYHWRHDRDDDGYWRNGHWRGF